MKAKPWKTYALWIVLVEAVGALSGFLSREGTKLYAAGMEKPPLSPPGIVFPIVWTILFALMGFGAARVWMAPPSQTRTRALWVFWIQLALNFFWSLIFFNLQAYGLAFFWLLALWALIWAMIVLFSRVDPLAGKLQIPYLVWVTFAAYLNLGVWILNR